ncbi:hypothetical protein AAE478_006662 [Parahypoxylon ruwenzoriense]
MKKRDITAVLMLSRLWAVVATGFRGEFKNIIRGSDLLLQWDTTNTASYPLVIHSRLINQTSEHGANSLEVNITVGLNASSFLWKSIPYPFPYIETAKYQVEVWPQNWAGSKASAPIFVSSPYFTIVNLEEGDSTSGFEDPFNGTIIIPSKPTDQPTSNSGINNNTAIAAGLVVPIAVILAVCGFVWMQQRQKKILDKKRKQREELCID